MTTQMTVAGAFKQVWCVDFEFSALQGNRPQPVCMVAMELRSGHAIRLWQDDLKQSQAPPYPTDASVLFVSYYASAELGCHLALNWPLPVQVLDLYTEFRTLTNGRPPICGNGLVGALTHYGLEGVGAVEKDEMRQLALRGGAVVIRRTGRPLGLLRNRCPGSDPPVAENVAEARPAEGFVTRKVYASGGAHGVGRYPH